MASCLPWVRRWPDARQRCADHADGPAWHWDDAYKINVVDGAETVLRHGSRLARPRRPVQELQPPARSTSGSLAVGSGDHHEFPPLIWLSGLGLGHDCSPLQRYKTVSWLLLDYVLTVRLSRRCRKKMAAVIGVLVLHLCLCSARAGVVLVSVMPQVRWWGMFGVGLMPGDMPDIPWTGQFPGGAWQYPGRHQHVGHGQEATPPGCPAKTRSRAADSPALQPPRGSAAGGAWLLSIILVCLRLAHYSSSISGRGSRGTITAADGGQENARIQATAGNPVTGSEWIAACYLHG